MSNQIKDQKKAGKPVAKKAKKTNNRKKGSNPQQQGKGQKKETIAQKYSSRIGAQFVPDAQRLIKIDVPMCPSAQLTWNLAIISRLYNIQTEFPETVWQMYIAMYADFLALAANKVDVVSSRLAYVNTLIQLIKAKTINGNMLDLSYSFSNLNIGGNPNPVITIRSFDYYMFLKGVDNGTQLSIQTAPPVYTIDVALVGYTLNIPLLQGENSMKMLMVQEVSAASKLYNSDATAYASRSPYWATGSCPSGGFSSAESETFCKSLPILSVFSELSNNLDRAARYFAFSSMDTCGAYGLPFLPVFNMKNYSTRLAPIVKFINFDELWTVWSSWFAEVIRKGNLVSGGDQQVVASYLAAPVPALYAQIAFRQTVLKYLFSSQAANQFQSYSHNVSGNWEGFRVGSNTGPRLVQDLWLPNTLNENLRSLESKVFNFGPKGTPEKISQIYMPVIGMFADYQLYEPTILVESVPTPVFGVATETGVNLIDGSNTIGTVFDFNSACINSAAAKLNEVIASLNQVTGEYGPPEGSSNFCLLAFTRYDQKDPQSIVKLSDIPQWAETATVRNVKLEFLLQKQKFDQSQKLRRTKSGKMPESEEFVYAPLAGIENHTVRAYSGCVPLTNEIKNVLMNQVVPSVLVGAPGVLGTIPQEIVQTSYNEKQWFTVSQSFGSTNAGLYTVQQQMVNLGTQYAPGIAAKPNGEVARSIVEVQRQGEGAFFDALFKGVMSFAQNL